MTMRLKLKRGLSDISPLFIKEGPRPEIRNEDISDALVPRAIAPEICFIWSVDDESDAHFLNNYFASKMVAPHASALLMTFLEDETENKPETSRPESWNRSLNRIRLPASRLPEAFQGFSWDCQQGSENIASPIFLEMGVKTLFSQPELIQLLDHIVIFLKPQIDSVTETYRKLKNLAASELRADVTILFDADDAAGMPSKLYELFSDFVSRRLSLSVNYLGTLHLSRGAEGLRHDLQWKSWASSRIYQSPSVEKMRFLSWVGRLTKKETAQ